MGLLPISEETVNDNHVGHPLTDPGDGRTECDVCGKWVFECIHSCKGVPVTDSAMARYKDRHGLK